MEYTSVYGKPSADAAVYFSTLASPLLWLFSARKIASGFYIFHSLSFRLSATFYLFLRSNQNVLLVQYFECYHWQWDSQFSQHFIAHVAVSSAVFYQLVKAVTQDFQANFIAVHRFCLLLNWFNRLQCADVLRSLPSATCCALDRSSR